MDELTAAMARVSVEDVSPRGRVQSARQVGRRSRFHVTVNTNRRPTTTAESEAIGADLRQALNRTLPSSARTGDLFTFREGGPGDIQRVDIKFSVEVGHSTRGGRVHAHAIVDVRHNALIHIDTLFLADVTAGAMADPLVRRCYVNVRSLATDDDVERYLLKPGYDPAEFSGGGGGAGAGAAGA